MQEMHIKASKGNHCITNRLAKLLKSDENEPDGRGSIEVDVVILDDGVINAD